MDIWYEHGACCVGLRGDVNNDGVDANTHDLVYLINYLYRFGPPALCPEEADVNGDGSSSNTNDLNYLINRIYRFGPPPPACP